MPNSKEYRISRVLHYMNTLQIKDVQIHKSSWRVSQLRRSGLLMKENPQLAPELFKLFSI